MAIRLPALTVGSHRDAPGAMALQHLAAEEGADDQRHHAGRGGRAGPAALPVMPSTSHGSATAATALPNSVMPPAMMAPYTGARRTRE